MLTGFKFLQILTLCSGTLDLFRIFLRQEWRKKKSYTISLNCSQYVWKGPSSARQMPKPDRTLKDFLNFPTLEEGRTLMFFSEFYINRTTLPCLSSLGRMYYICSPYHRRRNSIKLRLWEAWIQFPLRHQLLVQHWETTIFLWITGL